MHFDILVEDRSGERLLESIVPRILGPQSDPHTYTIHSYRGVGDLPKNLDRDADPQKRILLTQMPRLLRGFAKSRPGIDAAVVVLVDLDRRPCREFKQELLDMHRQLNPRPRTLFRLAIEEMEAWLLGDRAALLAEFPQAKLKVLDAYQQDSVCGTWERLADAIHAGGHRSLVADGYSAVGRAKSEWAARIGPHMQISRNASASFHAFCRGLRRLAEG